MQTAAVATAAPLAGATAAATSTANARSVPARPAPAAGMALSDTAAPPLRLMAWSFAFFNALRTVSYLPNIWQIVQSGRSDQHSLLTWLCFTGANLSTAWWVWETNGRRMDRVLLVTLVNGLLCALTGGVIVAYRWL